MAATPPTFVTYERGGRRVLTVTGTLDARWSNRLVSEFGAAAESLDPREDLVIDLSGVVTFETRALRTLARCSLLADALEISWHVIVSDALGRELDLVGADRRLPLVRLAPRSRAA
jgi:anti-anti-sigma regulatory factor